MPFWIRMRKGKKQRRKPYLYKTPELSDMEKTTEKTTCKEAPGTTTGRFNRRFGRLTCQLAIAVALTFAGILLLFLGFFFSPEGEIHNSVLIGFGEVATFAGALFGVDYRYKANCEL